MRVFLLPPSLLASLLLHARLTQGLENDFSAYPQGSQDCLYDAADQSKCTGDTGQELNGCLCSNQGNFIYNTANCVAKASPKDVETVYETLQNNCAGTGVTIAVDRDAFLAQAAAATSTTTSSSTSTTSTSSSTSSTSSATTTTTTSSPDTPSSTPDPSNNNDDLASEAISSGTKIGIGVGVAFGVLATGLAAWFIWAYQRRRHSGSPSGGLLGPNGSGSTPGSPTNAYAMTNTPRTEYAHDNSQNGAAELAPAEWKHQAGAGAGYYHPSAKDGGMQKSDMPLLAELGNTGAAVPTATNTTQAPVELPAEGFLNPHPHHNNSPNPGGRGYGYGHGQGQHPSVSPQDGRSPGGFSQTGQSEVSQFSSQYSNRGGY